MGRKAKPTPLVRDLKCKEIMTVEEAANTLQLGKETILRYIASGDITASHIGRPWRIRRVDLNQFLIKNENNMSS